MSSRFSYSFSLAVMQWLVSGAALGARSSEFRVRPRFSPDTTVLDDLAMPLTRSGLLVSNSTELEWEALEAGVVDGLHITDASASAVAQVDLDAPQTLVNGESFKVEVGGLEIPVSTDAVSVSTAGLTAVAQYLVGGFALPVGQRWLALRDDTGAELSGGSYARKRMKRADEMLGGDPTYRFDPGGTSGSDYLYIGTFGGTPPSAGYFGPLAAGTLAGWSIHDASTGGVTLLDGLWDHEAALLVGDYAGPRQMTWRMRF